MASTTLSKGTRKTYSFQEREILVNLICKYLTSSDDDGNSEISSISKRKSVWSQLTDEYNSLVGPENTRSSVQLRRCWENMKANKKNRDDKRIPEKDENDDSQQSSANAIGLPPNVVFQPKDSEPFTFEGLMPQTFETTETDEAKKDEVPSGDMEEEQVNDSLSIDELPFEAKMETNVKKLKRKTTSPKKQVKQKVQKYSKVQKNHELHEYTISEAQLRLDTAAILKEEAKLKLEEAEYRKEEARMRMVCATYKLQKLREECDDALEDEEEK